MYYCGNHNTDGEVLENHITTYLDQIANDDGMLNNGISIAMMNRDGGR